MEQYEIYTIDMSEAAKIINDACLESARDQKDLGNPPHPDVMRHRSGHGWRIYTRTTRDSRKASNGGDYSFWTDIWTDADGVHICEDWSADWDYRDWGGREWLCKSSTEKSMDALMYPAIEIACNAVGA